uniref:Deoxyuridine 5'-triphosphate nucleotidohydrolase n=1 Tax=Chelonoidis abingdonii TaxID=106734 RepID=A0A8C0GRX7_CHEAB
ALVSSMSPNCASSKAASPTGQPFVLLHLTVRLLTRGTSESAEVDLYAVAPDTIDPGTRKLIPIEIWVQLPRGCYGRVAPHSGLALCAGVHIQAGVVDYDYRGEVRVLLFHLGKEPMINVTLHLLNDSSHWCGQVMPQIQSSNMTAL